MNDTQNISLYLKLIITIVLLFWTGVVPTTSLLQQVHAGSYSDKNSPAIRADFNGDGSDDLAVGVPGQNIGGIANAGAVNVIYGSSPSGLTAQQPFDTVPANQFWHQNSQQNNIHIQGENSEDNWFGWG